MPLSGKTHKNYHFFWENFLRMNVATDQTIIFGLLIFLVHRSLSSIGQQILMTTSPPQLVALRGGGGVPTLNAIKNVHIFGGILP